MLNDVRQMREKIEKAKKEKALEQENLKEKQKREVYSKVHQQVKDVKRKNIETHKIRIRLDKTAFFLKISGVAALFMLLAFALHSTFSNSKDIRKVKILMEEGDADELDAAMASKYVKEILNDVADNGVNALENHWSSSADEESRFYGKELLCEINASSVDFKSVKSLPHNSLKVNCAYNGHPLSFSIGKDLENMSLISVN